MRRLILKPLDHLRVFHDPCGRWCGATKMGLSNHGKTKEGLFISIEALCLHCGVYFAAKMDTPASKRKREDGPVQSSVTP